MRSKKFLKTIVTIIASITLFVPFVSADEAYYTNMNGATLNKEQYDRLVKEFGYNTVATMTPYQIDEIKNVKDFHTQEEIKYIKTISYYNKAGELIQSSNLEVTKEEFEKLDNNLYLPNAGSVSAEINGRILTIKVRSNGGETRIVTLNNKWKSIPSVKSFDVLAIRPGGSNFYTKFIDGQYSGYQAYDNQLIAYNSTTGKDNFNFDFGTDNELDGDEGIGLSQNIVNSTQTSLENEMTIYFARNVKGFLVYGTYQHAVKDVTLTQSKKYDIHYSGFGSVVRFDSSIKSSYDASSGVQITYTYPDDDLFL